MVSRRSRTSRCVPRSCWVRCRRPSIARACANPGPQNPQRERCLVMAETGGFLRPYEPDRMRTSPSAPTIQRVASGLRRPASTRPVGSVRRDRRQFASGTTPWYRRRSSDRAAVASRRCLECYGSSTERCLCRWRAAWRRRRAHFRESCANTTRSYPRGAELQRSCQPDGLRFWATNSLFHENVPPVSAQSGKNVSQKLKYRSRSMPARSTRRKKDRDASACASEKVARSRNRRDR